MAQEMDLYGILGVPKNATVDDITKAGKKKTFEWHPDRHSESPESKALAQNKIQEINEAKRVLLDGKLRGIYDRGGYKAVKSHEETGGSSSPGTSAPSSSGRVHQRRVMTPDDLYRFFGGSGATPSPTVTTPSTSPATVTKDTNTSGMSLEERRRLRKEQMLKDQAGPGLAQRFNAVGEQILTISKDVRAATAGIVSEALTEDARMQVDSAAAKARQLLADIEEARKRFKR